MERVFLSFHFDQAGKRLADLAQDLIRSHGIQVLDGERLGGGALTLAIQQRIDRADGLICLLTERENDLDRTWIRDERAFAEGRGKRILSVVQAGSTDGGMFANNEQVRYDPVNPLPAFLKLSGTLGDWRRESGRFVRVVLEPSDLVREHAHAPNAELEYRCWTDDRASEWRAAVPKKVGHKQTVAFLKGVPEGAEIEVRLSHQGQVWESGAQPQLLNVRLGE